RRRCGRGRRPRRTWRRWCRVWSWRLLGSAFGAARVPVRAVADGGLAALDARADVRSGEWLHFSVPQRPSVPPRVFPQVRGGAVGGRCEQASVPLSVPSVPPDVEGTASVPRVASPLFVQVSAGFGGVGGRWGRCFVPSLC